MNNSFFTDKRLQLLYVGIWVTIIVIQIFLLRNLFTDFFISYSGSIVTDSIISNILLAICILAVWYPIKYYRNILNIFLFVLFHLFLFVLLITISLGISYFFTHYLFLDNDFYRDFFITILPIRIILALLLYIIFILVYYLFFIYSELNHRNLITENDDIETITPALEKISRISVKKNKEIHFIPVDKIIYIEANGDYVMIHTSDAKFLKDKTMKYWESNLPDDLFIRIHRSFIINLEFISKVELYEKDSYHIHMKNGASLKASAAGYKYLKQKMQL